MSLYKRIFPDPLILYLLLALILAYFFPQFSYYKFNEIGLQHIIDFGVIIVFFLYGVKLKWNEVFKDLLNWKLHLRIQLITFLLFPILGILLFPITKFNESFYPLFLAIFYLCALPSTVSSSVVMVSIAKGNITSAIFNASLSGLIGIVLTPLWMSLFLKQGESVESSSIFIGLITSVILPVFLGAIFQPFLGKYYDKFKNGLSNIDKLTIVLIVYNSFSHTFLDGLFSSIGVGNFLITIGLVVLLFFVSFYLIQFLNQKFWNLKREDFITLQFCGTKKSLVHGSVMGSVIFGGEIGLFLLPIMVYHTFQLLYISFKASQYAREVE